jgi:hypothetical protein
MSQLKLWSDKYLSEFVDYSQQFNKIERDTVKAELWEMPESCLAYKSMREIEERKSLEERIIKIENTPIELGLSERQSKAIINIAKRKNLLNELGLALDYFKSDYVSALKQYKDMSEDPVFFNQKNKKIRNTENDLLTFGSLSLSYSFCSPIRLISSIIDDAEYIKSYHKIMIESSDEDHRLEDFDYGLISENRKEKSIKMKYQSLLQDLSGNKVSQSLLEELSEKMNIGKRPDSRDDWGVAVINKESLIDSFYIFFGSKRGSDFVKEWEIESSREELKNEFKHLIYNNPYVNPLLVDLTLNDFMSEEHINSAEAFLKYNRGLENREGNNELDFGLED